MKYELVHLNDNFKNKYIYKDNNESYCIDIDNLLKINTKLISPIGIFINGIFIEFSNYKFENNKIIVNKNYPVYSRDIIYILFVSVDPNNSGFLYQHRIDDFIIIDDNSISLVEPLINISNIVAVIVNGIVYYKDLFNINDNKIEFIKYRPDIGDDLSILFFKKV